MYSLDSGQAAFWDFDATDAPPKGCPLATQVGGLQGPFRAAFKSLFLVLATLHGGGKGQVSSSRGNLMSSFFVADREDQSILCT